ncbi:putative invertase inhibitor [Malania oleifera]|uniref:putative invertase inhibitor n=1 Tax=Malania oleifera TaxID=397392 RepID=UPI0025AE5001|nr:putative invertase inhibitor [Malania oleifera]
MWHLSHFSTSVCFFIFFFLLPHQTSCSITPISIDLINTTCDSCASESTIFDYGFCLASLQAIPISYATNLQGLAIIAMELAIENATSTVSGIIKLLSNGTFDQYTTLCLEDCLELYIDAIATLGNSIGTFLSGQYDIANVWLSSVMEGAKTCEGGFEEKAGGVYPLTKENYNLFQLCDIALCIIHMLSQPLPSY